MRGFWAACFSMAAGLGATALATPALAAPSSAPHDGFYAGVNGGGEWVDASAALNVASPSGSSAAGIGAQRITGALVGGQVGYQAHAGALVFGAEGDFDSANASTGATAPLFVLLPFEPGDTASAREEFSGSLRAKVGVTARRLLVYATAGVAFANVRGRADLVQSAAGGPLIATQSKTLTGYTVGGGIEQRFGLHWGLGLEYRYSDYGRATYGLGGLNRPFFPNSTVTATIHPTSQALTGRLNYHF